MRLGVVLRYVGIIMLVVALFMLLSAGVSLVLSLIHISEPTRH